jgi:DNA-binding response OmpR family regulator
VKVLIAEDVKRLADDIAEGLRDQGMAVDVAYDGTDATFKLDVYHYDVLVLDRDLPGVHGDTICRQIAGSGKQVMVLMLTASGAPGDRVAGLGLGADDYLPKPFDTTELLARVRALLRREQLHKATAIRIADLEIDTTTHQVRRGGLEISLTPREFTLLEALARNEGRTLTREIIQEQVWGDEDSFSDTVRFHVASLRKKIDADQPVKLIHTIYGVGYVLRCSEGEDAP